mgnify:CR=1 FL=1
MILYKFYRALDENIDTSDLRMNEKYPLYAFTTDKKIYKDFKNMRNMSKFHVIKSEISKSDFVEFANSHSNAKLDYFTYSSVDKNKYRMMDIYILSTWHERENTDAIASEGYIYGICDPEYHFNFNISLNPFILKNKWIKLLKDIVYIDAWKLFGNPEKFLSSISDDDKNDFLGYEYPDTVHIDESAIFVFLYGELLK